MVKKHNEKVNDHKADTIKEFKDIFDGHKDWKELSPILRLKIRK